jgi:hypothetical protein
MYTEREHARERERQSEKEREGERELTILRNGR